MVRMITGLSHKCKQEKEDEHEETFKALFFDIGLDASLLLILHMLITKWAIFFLASFLGVFTVGIIRITSKRYLPDNRKQNLPSL